MSGSEKSIVRKTESAVDDMVDLWRRRKGVCIVVVLIIVAPVCFTVFREAVTIPALQGKAYAAQSELEKERQSHREEIQKSIVRIQELQTELAPFRTLAIQKFSTADATAMQKLAEHLITLETDLTHAQTQLDTLKETVSELKPTFTLLERQQFKRGEIWLTCLAFGSKTGHPFAQFAVSAVFDKEYDSATACITGQGIAVAGELITLEGATNSRIFRFHGTQLMANNFLLVEFRSKQPINEVALQVEPRGK